MHNFTKDLYAKMKQQLQDISSNAGSTLYAAEQSYHAVTDSLKELKTFTKDYVFKDQDEEIMFFKEIKPRFLREVIYFMKIFDIETATPVGSAKTQKAYYLGWLDLLRSYFDRNRFLYMYYRMDKSHMDERMFVREPSDIPLIPSYTLDADPEFSNVFSYKLAKIQAFEDLSGFLQGYISALGNNGQVAWYKEKNEDKLVFTGKDALFFEIGYMLKAAGVFNNGNAPLKLIFNVLQQSWNRKATHYYSYFQAMRIRKKNRTPGLDMCKDYLIRYMNNSDENPRYK